MVMGNKSSPVSTSSGGTDTAGVDGGVKGPAWRAWKHVEPHRKRTTSKGGKRTNAQAMRNYCRHFNK